MKRTFQRQQGNNGNSGLLTLDQIKGVIDGKDDPRASATEMWADPGFRDAVNRCSMTPDQVELAIKVSAGYVVEPAMIVAPELEILNGSHEPWIFDIRDADPIDSVEIHADKKGVMAKVGNLVETGILNLGGPSIAKDGSRCLVFAGVEYQGKVHRLGKNANLAFAIAKAVDAKPVLIAKPIKPVRKV